MVRYLYYITSCVSICLFVCQTYYLRTYYVRTYTTFKFPTGLPKDSSTASNHGGLMFTEMVKKQVVQIHSAKMYTCLVSKCLSSFKQFGLNSTLFRVLFQFTARKFFSSLKLHFSLVIEVQKMIQEKNFPLRGRRPSSGNVFENHFLN